MNKKILVGVAWPYVNGDLHPGHLAGYLLPADIFARFCRLCGDDVLMVSGSDCHGTPITVQADKENLTTIQIVEKYHKRDIELFKKYQLSYNLYTKTTTENHKKIVQEIFLDLLKNGYIKKGVMKQYYSRQENKFLPDRYVEGECPFCHSQNQRSDQCEICGRWIPDGELINPKSKLSGNTVELKDTEHYFLDFEALKSELDQYVDSKKDIWRNWVYKESEGWLREGLKPRAITRDMDWAIELPVLEIKKLSNDKQLSNFEGKNIYVWFEAVIGYLSASIEWSNLKQEEGDIIFYRYQNQSTDWKEWWFDPKSEHVYFMGQDNLVFHTLMWPAQLIGTGKNYTLPHNVSVNKFLNLEGDKFSKSRGNTVDLSKLLEIYGLDTIRFYIASILPENKEGDFRWSDFQSKNNSELVGNLGNFVNRTLVFASNKFKESDLNFTQFELDSNLKNLLDKTYSQTEEYLYSCKFVSAYKSIMELSSFGNKYFDEQKIWEVIKIDQQKARAILFNLLNIVLNLAILTRPFVPDTSDSILEMLGLDQIAPKVGENFWKSKIVTKFSISNIRILFRKIEEIVPIPK